MKTFTIVAIVGVVVMVACLVPSSQATPVPPVVVGHALEGEDAQLVPAPFVEERANRHARATCDLLSFTSKWLSVNHSACAAHCLALMRGFKGGRCENAVCVCRR